MSQGLGFQQKKGALNICFYVFYSFFVNVQFELMLNKNILEKEKLPHVCLEFSTEYYFEICLYLILLTPKMCSKTSI